MTEGTHPAVVCVAGEEEDHANCISATSNTDLVAVGTKLGRITVWDVNRVLLVMASLTVILLLLKMLHFIISCVMCFFVLQFHSYIS